MSSKEHLPLAVAAVAVIATQILCTRSTNETIRRYSVDEVMVTSPLQLLNKTAESIDEQTKALNRRFMTPGELLQEMQLHPTVDPMETQRLLDSLSKANGSR